MNHDLKKMTSAMRRFGLFIIARVMDPECENKRCPGFNQSFEFVHVDSKLKFCSVACLTQHLERLEQDARFDRDAEISSGGQC